MIDGTLEWSEAPLDDRPTTAFRIEHVNGVATKQWLSDEIAIDASGIFLDGVHPPFPFEIGVHRPESRHFVWNAALHQIPLAAAESPLVGLAEAGDFAGTLDVRLQLFTGDDGLNRIRIEGDVRDAVIRPKRTRTRFKYDRVELDALLEIDPVEIRLVDATLSGPELKLRAQGSVARPIRERAAMRVQVRTDNVELAGIRRYVDSLEGDSQTGRTISRLTERVIEGRVEYIEISGRTSLRRWGDLVSGRVQELPAGFVLSGAFEDVVVASGASDRIEELEGTIEWAEDRLVFRNGRGRYRGDPLPEMNAVVTGVEHLVGPPAEEREITRAPPPLPGLAPLLALLRPRNPDKLPPLSAIGLAFDGLEHPILRWPLRDLKVLVEPLRRGLEVTIRDGRWGGAAISGELVWFTDAKAPSVSATLALGPAVATSRSEPKRSAQNGTREALRGGTRFDASPPERWGQARFEAEFRPRRWLPFEHATGLLRFEGTRVFFDDLDVRVVERGTFAARMQLDLDRDDSVGFDTSFALTEGELTQIGPFVALPQDLTRGDIEASGSLTGRLRPGQGFISELTGNVRADARNGNVRLSLPLLLRLAKATEGYNPNASEGELTYETMGGSFAIDHGTLSVQDFEIEGPLRVFAQAELNTNERPVPIRGVVGIFLFRKPNAILENLPIIRSFLPGSERGLIGTYFEVKGPVGDPEVEAMPLETLMTGVPEVIKAPFKVLRQLFEGGGGS